eukprot:1385699-Rhodomonas_salina.1
MSAYSVESSFVNNAVGKLPTTGSGGYFNSGTGATGRSTPILFQLDRLIQSYVRLSERRRRIVRG